jgi:hypothetical protein
MQPDRLRENIELLAAIATIIGLFVSLFALLLQIRQSFSSRNVTTPQPPTTDIRRLDRDNGWYMLISLLVAITLVFLLSLLLHFVHQLFLLPRLPTSLQWYLISQFFLLWIACGVNFLWLRVFTNYHAALKPIWVLFSAQGMAVFEVSGSFIVIIALSAILSI